MRLLFLTVLCFLHFPWFHPCEETDLDCPWLILYSAHAEIAELEHYNPIIFDPQEHPSLTALKEKKVRVYGRMDLADLFQKKNDSDHADLRWTDRILKESIPHLLKTGFNGVYLEGIEKLKQASLHTSNMQNELAQLILLLRVQFPDLPILVKNGTSLLGEIGYSIQGIIETSVTTTYNVNTHSYQFVSEAIHEEKVRTLKQVQANYPHLQIFTLDYWDPTDSKGVEEIYYTEKKLGFRPYVASIELDTIVRMP